jgi:hypothetical protein
LVKVKQLLRKADLGDDTAEMRIGSPPNPQELPS